MALNRSIHAAKTLNPGWLDFWGEFAPNGNSAVAASSRKGRGFTVARTSAGLFTVTFLWSFLDLAAPWAHLRLGTGGDQKAEVGAISVANKTMQIRIWDISGAAVDDVAANAANIISFGCKLRIQKIGPILG